MKLPRYSPTRIRPGEAAELNAGRNFDVLAANLAKAYGEIEQSFEDTLKQIVSRSTIAGMIRQHAAVFNVLDYGAKGDGVTDDSAAIQRADTAASLVGGKVYFPKGTYLVSSSVSISSGVVWEGDGKYLSILKAPVLSAGNNLEIISTSNTSNWTIRKLGFDGNSSNYPNPATTIPKIVDGVNPSLSFPTVSAIWVALSTSAGTDSVGVNCSVLDCYYSNLTNWGVRFRLPTGTDSWRNIRIEDNHFYRASYQERVISIFGLLNSGTSFARNIHVNRNTIRENSCTKYIKPGLAGLNSSTDAIEINKCQNFEAIGNVVDYVAGGGIRVEASEEGVVNGNTVTDAGQEGISCYNVCKNIAVIGNTVKRWGRIPAFHGIRRYPNSASTAYYIARETPLSGTVNLPADPSASSWFELNPYSLAGASANTIPVYDTANYVSGTTYSGDITAVPPTGFNTASTQGIAPFRGFAGIAVTQLSERITISGNVIEGSLTQTGGLYDYASDFGISTVHNANDPQTYKSPLILGPNSIRNCRVREVYQPGYVDPVNRRGVIEGLKFYPGQMGYKTLSSAQADEPKELFPSLSENVLYSETVPGITFSTGGYAKVAGANRPSIGTGAFGLFLHVRFSSLLSTTAKYLFDAGVGGAATIGFRVLVKRGEINFSCTDGATNFEVKYQTVTDWGSNDNYTALIYVARDTDGTLRLWVNGAEKSAAGPSPVVDLDTGNDIGIGAASNGTSQDIPFEIFKCVMWSGSFTAQQITERAYQKKLIRNGDTVLMDLDMRARGLEWMDKASLSRQILLTSSGVSVSDPLPQIRRVLSVNTTAVGNVGAGEDDLMTYSVPGNTLYVDGESLIIRCAGTFAANANNKRIRAYFGSDLLYDTTALAFNTGDWQIEIEIVRTGATTQKAYVRWTCGNTTVTTSQGDYTTPGRTLSSANTVKLTGEATSNDDIKQELMRVEKVPAA